MGRLFYVVNLGCRVNRVESDRIQAELERRGDRVCKQTADRAAADLVIVNTCTVTGEAEKKARKAVHRALKDAPHARIIVTGCAIEINPSEFSALDPRVAVMGKADLCNLSKDAPARVGSEYPTRVGVKVQDGCDRACTYCIVHTARGPSRSRDVEDVLEEVCALASAGVHEVVITGINVGCYNDRGCSLSKLLVRIRKTAPSARVRLSSIEPDTITPELIDVIASDKGICNHLHIPVQSGSTNVLRQMARPYDRAMIIELTNRIRDVIPTISFSTDIIAGFPGETDDDFAQTLSLVREVRFSKVHVFRYSRREGTPAANRPDQIPPDCISRRAHQLQCVADEVRLSEQRKRIGCVEHIIVEQSGEGVTESFFPVHVGNHGKCGDIMSATLTGIDEDGIFTL
jgi:threonylcarbamoyladenosine tRNA methylthiotransferase MtaB